MPLTERTERALEACHDAILAPTRWPSALQSLGESLGAASCMFFEHDRENSPAPAPMSEGHVAFADRLTRNWAHAPDPHVGPYLQKCDSFQRAGWVSVLEHDLSTEDERRTIPFYPETARPEKREWMAGSFFSVEGGNWCLLGFSAEATRSPAKTRDALPGVGPYLAKIVSLARKFAAAFDLTSSKLSALERVSSAAIVIDATGRAKQGERACARSARRDFKLIHGRPAARDPASNRRPQQLVSFVLIAERGSAQAFAPDRRRSRRSALASVEAMPVTAFGSDLFSSGRVILLLTDSRSPLRPEACNFAPHSA